MASTRLLLRHPLPRFGFAIVVGDVDDAPRVGVCSRAVVWRRKPRGSLAENNPFDSNDLRCYDADRPVAARAIDATARKTPPGALAHKGLRRRGLRGRRTAAPLKRAVAYHHGLGPDESPRSKDRGSIETPRSSRTSK